MSQALVKQPAESLLYDLPVGDLGADEIVAVLAVTATPRGLVPEVAALEISGEVFSGRTVQFRARGGTDGELYLITARVATAAGNEMEAEGELHVLDLSWTLPPDQGNAYLAPTDYVARFGVEELVRLTDELGVGRVGKAALFAALADASAEIDGYLSRRYLTPISPVPPLIANVCAEIARYRLHGDAVPEVVSTRYRDALRILERLAQGVMVLPGSVTAQSSPGMPLVSAAPRVFSPRTLKGF